MMAYSGGSCVSVIDKTITLLAVPQLTFTAPSAVCINGGSVQLAAQEIAGVSGAGVYTGISVSNTGLFDPATAGAGTFTINYVYNAANGCPVTASQSITVNPIPVITVGPDITGTCRWQRKPPGNS